MQRWFLLSHLGFCFQYELRDGLKPVIVQKHYYAAFRRLTAEALALRKLRQFFLRIFSHRFYKLGSVRALLARGHAVYSRKQDVRQDKLLYLALLPELLCGLLQIVDNGYDVEIFS